MRFKNAKMQVTLYLSQSTSSLMTTVVGTHFVLCTDYDVIEEEEMPQFSVTFHQLNNEGVADKVSLRPILTLKRDSKVNERSLMTLH